jgi:hypothetical protein
MAELEGAYPFYESFVRAWWRADAIQEVCLELGIDRREASNVAAALRRRGFHLKTFASGVDRSRKRKGNALTGREDIARLHRVCLEESNFYRDRLDDRKSREADELQKEQVRLENEKTLKDVERLRQKMG